MKKLTAKDLKNLQHGDVVHQFKGTNERKLHFVGKMPNNSNYLIFCNGEHLEFLYINDITESFKYDWYDNKLSFGEIGEIIISKIDEKINDLIKDKENVREIYIDKTVDII